MRKKKAQEIPMRSHAKPRMRSDLPKILGAESAGKVSTLARPAMRKHKDKPKTKRPGTDSGILRDSLKLQSVDGIPDESQVDETARALPSADRRTLKKLLKLVAEHLGSHEAARLWVFTPFSQLSTTPLDAVRKGDAKLILKILESQWGRTPIYT